MDIVSWSFMEKTLTHTKNARDWERQGNSRRYKQGIKQVLSKYACASCANHDSVGCPGGTAPAAGANTTCIGTAGFPGSFGTAGGWRLRRRDHAAQGSPKPLVWVFWGFVDSPTRHWDYMKTMKTVRTWKQNVLDDYLWCNVGKWLITSPPLTIE